VVGHATLAPSGTPTSALTARNRAGGDVVTTFAVFKCLSSARLGDLLRGYTWESLSLFECAPSQMLLAARQVCLLLLHYLSSLLMCVQDWFWNFMLSFFSPRIVDQ
jgi:SP family sugar:H+ symporter-like MFS transporter